APLIVLRLDVDFLDPGYLLQPRHVDLIVEVPDVADDRLVLHPRHLSGGDDVVVAGRRNEDVGSLDQIVERVDLVAFHGRLERARRDQRCLSFAIDPRIRSRITPHSSGWPCGSNAGTDPTFSNSTPLCTTSVASPPSSTMSVGPEPSGHSSASLVHHQYSSSVSPFHAKTGVPFGSFAVPPVSGLPTTTAAAA